MTDRFHRHGVGAPGPRAERGIVLFVALIVLVVMALAGIAMMRQSGSGVSISGNLAFKQNATNVADIGTEAARNWILGQTAGALSNDSLPGYYSSWNGNTDVDPTTLPWGTQSIVATANDGTSNKVEYIVHRLCKFPNMPANAPGQYCAAADVAGTGGSHGSIGYPGPGPSISSQVYYRVSSKVTGPKNTVSYIEVVLK